jgi:hypothetical protein
MTNISIDDYQDVAETSGDYPEYWPLVPIEKVS